MDKKEEKMESVKAKLFALQRRKGKKEKFVKPGFKAKEPKA